MEGDANGIVWMAGNLLFFLSFFFFLSFLGFIFFFLKLGKWWSLIFSFFLSIEQENL